MTPSTPATSRSTARRTSALGALLVGALFTAPAPARADDDAERIGRCMSRLGAALDERGYTHDLVYDPDLRAPSVVDATTARAADSDRDVTVMTDGVRVHAVAPFLTHSRARGLVRYAERQTDDPTGQVCFVIRSVQEDSRMRAAQRLILGAIAAAAALVFLAVARHLGRAPLAQNPK